MGKERRSDDGLKEAAVKKPHLLNRLLTEYEALMLQDLKRNKDLLSAEDRVRYLRGEPLKQILGKKYRP